MIGLFDRHLLAQARRGQTTQAFLEANRDSFILDWSLDETETDKPSTEETAAKAHPRSEPCGR